MSWVIYLNFLSTGKSLCWLNSKLSFISLHSFEMLSDCFIIWLYMHVLKLILGKIFSANFSLSFCLFSVKRLNGLSWRPDGRGSVGQTVMLHVRTRVLWRPDGKVTRPDSHGLSARLWFNAGPDEVNEPSGWGPHNLYKTWPQHFQPTPLILSLSFGFLWVTSREFLLFLALFCPVVHYLLHSRYFFLLTLFFSVSFKTVRIVIMLGILMSFFREC
jgi:hypothetical protein